MDEQITKIACPPEKRTVRACGEGRRPGGEGGVFVPTIRTSGGLGTIMTRGRPSCDDRAKQDNWRAGKLLNYLRRQIMATNYANEKLTTAIKIHLFSVDAIPPTAEVSKLANELAQVCLTEFKTAGMGSEAVENLFAPSAFKAKARGVD